jgi:uncharacterized membrane protein YvbJ
MGKDSVGLPGLVCPECKAPNDSAAVMCKRCGEILSSKPKRPSAKKGSSEEYDATQGAFSTSCIVVPVVLILLGVIILFLSFGGSAKPGTCKYNREKIGKAVYAYDKQNPSAKMDSLDLNKLTQPGRNGKSYLKDRPVCPKDSNAEYFIDKDGLISCRTCGRH